MKKIITFLAELGFWRFVFLFTVLVMFVAEFLISLQSYWLTGSFFNKNLMIVGFITPLIDGFFIFLLVAFLIRHLKQLQNEQEETINLKDKIEKELKKSESYQRTLLDSFPFLVWLKDTQSNFLAVNKPFAKAAGLKNPSELIGKNDLDCWPEDLANAYRADDKAVMESLQIKELEEFIEDDGELRWFETYKAPILDNEGNIFGTVGFARDITELKQSKEELKLMKYALDNVPEAVYLSDKDGFFMYVSEGAVRQSGYTKEELKKMAIADIDPKFLQSNAPEHWERLKKNGSLTFRVIHRCKDTSTFPAEINANYVEYRGVGYNLAFSRNITQRVLAEEKLKQSANVFTYAREGIIITDNYNNIIDVNQAFMDITGYSRDEVLGKNPSILQSGRNDENFYKKLWEHLQRDGMWKGEMWNQNKGGNEYAEHLTISAVCDDNKEVKNYVAIFTDITLQKKQQKELEHLANYDMLTNLPNRLLFADRMKQAMAQAIRKEQIIALMYIDIDGFKQVNDSYGHDTGDKLLILLADKMSTLLREGDTLSRVGGDEFIALLIDIQEKESVVSFVTRLLASVSESIFIQEHPIQVSASVGISFYPQADKLDANEIIRQADKAMYKAKMSGKNRYVYYTE
ncbi:PAS domain S-box protein [bacterium]|nr:PAS domain S-box protein [bacterium]MBU1993769.1 PAS domain S-box protein [bacterium]